MNRAVLADATRRLAAAGVESARVDAELLAAHVLGIDRGRLVASDDMTEAQRVSFDGLVARRVSREPLQHIVGAAPFGPVELAVGPGVFTPRPETELILEWAVGIGRSLARPRIVDLCSGSGALAIAIATMLPDSTVTAVENDPDALIWLRRNVADVDLGGRVSVLAGDARDRTVLGGARSDLIVSNPPYVPTGVALAPEVTDHDPDVAVFAGADGMSVITPMLDLIADTLEPGGRCAIEHDDTTADLVVAAVGRSGRFDAITEHVDLAGRPRFVSARRVPEAIDAGMRR